MRILFIAIPLLSIFQFSTCISKSNNLTEKEKLAAKFKAQVEEKHKIDSALFIGTWQQSGHTGIALIIDANTISSSSGAGEKLYPEKYSWGVDNKIYITGKSDDKVYVNPYKVFVSKDTLVLQGEQYMRFYTRFTTNTSAKELRPVIDDTTIVSKGGSEGEK